MNPAQLDVMRRILELATSAREGLANVNGKNRPGGFKSAAHVLTGVIVSFAQIQYDRYRSSASRRKTSYIKPVSRCKKAFGSKWSPTHHVITRHCSTSPH